MVRIAYTVIASFPDERSRDEYIAWLEDGHVDQVIAGGAHSAMIVQLDRDPPGAGPLVAEVRYIFATRELYDRYIREHAPALRAEGLAKFPPERGIGFRRSVGEII